MIIIGIISVFFILVFFHELGHFIMAKITGMKVEEFAIGMGPKLISFKIGETKYSIGIIPIGGYNKIVGMGPEEQNEERGFTKKSLGARLLVIASGGAMNIVLPIFLLFTIYFLNGIEKIENKPIIGSVANNSPAYHAGIYVNDKILKINNIEIKTWNKVIDVIKNNHDKEIVFLIERYNKEVNIKIHPIYNKEIKKITLGITQKTYRQKLGCLDSFKLAIIRTYKIAKFIIFSLFSIILGKNKAEFAGPIGLIAMTRDAVKIGWLYLLEFLASFSINLGIINLIPIPVLDGGYIVILLIEAIRRKSFSTNILYKIQIVGFFLLTSLLLFATIQDLLRIS